MLLLKGKNCLHKKQEKLRWCCAKLKYTGNSICLLGHILVKQQLRFVAIFSPQSDSRFTATFHVISKLT